MPIVRHHSKAAVLLAMAMFVVITLFFGLLSAQTDATDSTDSAQADSLYKAGRWAEAANAYESLLPMLQGDERADALVKYGYCFERQSQREQAVAIYRQAVALENVGPNHKASALLRLGYLLRLLKESDEALDALEKAANLPGAHPNTVAQALLFAAWEHGTLHQDDAALADFDRVTKIPEVHDNYVATALLSIARTHQRRNELHAAIAALKKIDDLDVVASSNRSRANIYRLECEALLEGDVPFHIRPYVTKVTGSTAKLMWVSQGEVDPGIANVVIDGKTRMFLPKSTPLKDTICQHHVVELVGLTPGKRYTYRVTAGEQTEVGTFRAAPADSSPFSFAVIGDTQSYHPGLQPLLDRMAAEETDFVLHVGDLTDRGDHWGEWKGSFFDPGHGYFNKNVFWTVYGNHDGGPYFPQLFDMPSANMWHSFDWGDVHFVILDSYGAGSGGEGKARQLAWLKQDLQANQKPWTIAALHVPMVATRRSLDWFGDGDILPVLEQHEVDIVFSGHHPHYRRYHPIGTDGKRPIMHVTSGGGGGPVGGAMPSPLLARGVDVNHYCRVDVTKDRLTLTARSISGAEIDQFEIQKGAPLTPDADATIAAATPVAKQVISLYQELLTDRTFELHLSASTPPQPGAKVTLILDLAKLPRGPLDPQQFDAETRLMLESADKSPWQIEPQSVLLSEGRIRINTTAPEKLSITESRVLPSAVVRLRLKQGSQLFQPYETTARIFVAR